MEFKSIYSKTRRKKLIETEKERLTGIFLELDEGTYESIKKLIDDAAFMATMLSELRLIVERDGPVEPYQNGENQKGMKKSAAVEAYDKMVNTYAKVIKQMVDTLPKRIRIQDDDGTQRIEEIDDDSPAALVAYVSSLKK